MQVPKKLYELSVKMSDSLMLNPCHLSDFFGESPFFSAIPTLAAVVGRMMMKPVVVKLVRACSLAVKHRGREFSLTKNL